MKEYYYAVFMKSESCDYYNGLYKGSPEDVLTQLKKEHEEELAYMGEVLIDGNDKKATKKLDKILHEAIEACERDDY